MGDKNNGLYVKTEIGKINVDSWNEVIEIYEEKTTDSDFMRIGYYGHAIEFSFDGIFLYPIDTTNRRYGCSDSYFTSLHELSIVMAGKFINEFVLALPGHIPIRNDTLTEDYYVYELRDFIRAGFKSVTLYPEDYHSAHDWEAVCDCLGVQHSSGSIDFVATDIVSDVSVE